MALPKQVEIWTDLRIVVRNFESHDVGGPWADAGVMIHSLDYDKELDENTGMLFVEKEKIPELIRALQEFVD